MSSALLPSSTCPSGETNARLQDVRPCSNKLEPHLPTPSIPVKSDSEAVLSTDACYISRATGPISGRRSRGDHHNSHISLGGVGSYKRHADSDVKTRSRYASNRRRALPGRGVGVTSVEAITALRQGDDVVPYSTSATATPTMEDCIPRQISHPPLSAAGPTCCKDVQRGTEPPRQYYQDRGGADARLQS